MSHEELVLLRTTIPAFKGRSRRRALAVLGGKCVRCGFSDERALQLDHINGRDKGKAKLNTQTAYSFLVRDPEEGRKIYQLLCANCNWIKRVVNREYSGY